MIKKKMIRMRILWAAGLSLTNQRVHRAMVGMNVYFIACVLAVCGVCVADAVQTLPESRGGQELVGTKMPALTLDRWLNTESNKPLDTSGSVTLYRWWTSECPFCKATLPGLERFRQKYGEKGLRIVAVYHPKPPRAVPDSLVLKAAAGIGYRGAIAVDLNWSQLKKAYPANRGATSISVLVDKDGIIRFVHPGPDYYPSDEKENAQQDEDYRLMEKAVETLLK
jgi:thiol-disulfide isomerase/thioredoxin